MQAVLACRAGGDPSPRVSFGFKERWQDHSWQIPPMSYSELNVRTMWIDKPALSRRYRLNLQGEPYGLVSEAFINITMPSDSLKDKVGAGTSFSIHTQASRLSQIFIPVL